MSGCLPGQSGASSLRGLGGVPGAEFELSLDVIVTISREYGAAGPAVADGVAHALGYELLADDVPQTVASRLGTTAEEVTKRATAGASLGERMLTGLGFGTAEGLSPAAPVLPGDFDESVRREIERTVRERAAAGNVVILGRGAPALLAQRSDVVRAFLVASKAFRVARLVDAFRIAPEQAARDIERVDAARKAFARERYNYAWNDPHFYDVVVDVSRTGISAAIEIVTCAVRTREAVTH